MTPQLELGVIEESQVSEWSQAQSVPRSDGQWLAYSEHTRNTYAARYNETYVLRSTRLHSWISSNSPFSERLVAYKICEMYIDDVLIRRKSDPEFLDNTRRVFAISR